MIVHDLHVKSIARAPAKTDTGSYVNTNAMLPPPIALQFLQSQTGPRLPGRQACEQHRAKLTFLMRPDVVRAARPSAQPSSFAAPRYPMFQRSRRSESAQPKILPSNHKAIKTRTIAKLTAPQSAPRWSRRLF